MKATLRAEARKVRSTRSVWALPGVGVVIAIVGGILLMAAGKDADVADRLSALGPLRFGPTNFGLLVVVLGIRVFADETHHRTLSTTFVRTPDRVRVFMAKTAVAALLTAALCVVVDVVTIAITLIGVRARGWHMIYDVVPTAAMLGRVAMAMVLLAVIGVALGVAIGNRTVAIVATVVWFALAEDMLGALLHVTRYLPGAAVQGVVGNTSTPDHVAAVGSAALLALYLTAIGLTASAALRRDVD